MAAGTPNAASFASSSAGVLPLVLLLLLLLLLLPSDAGGGRRRSGGCGGGVCGRCGGAARRAVREGDPHGSQRGVLPEDVLEHACGDRLDNRRARALQRRVRLQTPPARAASARTKSPRWYSFASPAMPTRRPRARSPRRKDAADAALHRKGRGGRVIPSHRTPAAAPAAGVLLRELVVGPLGR